MSHVALLEKVNRVLPHRNSQRKTDLSVSSGSFTNSYEKQKLSLTVKLTFADFCQHSVWSLDVFHHSKAAGTSSDPKSAFD